MSKRNLDPLLGRYAPQAHFKAALLNHFGHANVRVQRESKKGRLGIIEVRCAHYTTSKVKVGERKRKRDFSGVGVVFEISRPAWILPFYAGWLPLEVDWQVDARG